MKKDLTEQELLERARSGDQDAFGVLMKQNESRIYNLALRLTGNPDDALELSQEAFFNAWKGLPRFQGESAFSTWVYRLASNVCIDFLRREKRRRGLSMTFSLDDEEESRQAELPDNRFSPEEALERRELRQSILQGPALTAKVFAPEWELFRPPIVHNMNDSGKEGSVWTAASTIPN